MPVDLLIKHHSTAFRLFALKCFISRLRIKLWPECWVWLIAWHCLFLLWKATKQTFWVLYSMCHRMRMPLHYSKNAWQSFYRTADTDTTTSEIVCKGHNLLHIRVPWGSTPLWFLWDCILAKSGLKNLESVYSVTWCVWHFKKNISVSMNFYFFWQWFFFFQAFVLLASECLWRRLCEDIISTRSILCQSEGPEQNGYQFIQVPLPYPCLKMRIASLPQNDRVYLIGRCDIGFISLVLAVCSGHGSIKV